jgi:ribosomal-protein-alanine N-acetyltransferase
MSALLQSPEAQLEPLLPHHLPEVMAIEQRAYPHPWSLVNFQDALMAGYEARVLTGGVSVLGYYLAMKGVDEAHLLNITVAPDYQRQGWARLMLDALTIWARGQGLQWLWLEARVSNLRAMQVYEDHGYRQVGQRKSYYPAGCGKREDAVVMSLRL